MLNKQAADYNLVAFVSTLQSANEKEQQELVLILNSNMSNYLNLISIDFH